MATAPFGAVLETALKESEQGGKLTMMKDIVVTPQFFCCLSGSSIGLNKDPVPVLVVTPTSQCTNADVVAEAGLSWSPTATLDLWEIDWGDGNTNNGNFAGATSATHQYTDPGTFTVTLTVTDNVGATASTEVEVQISECFPVIEFMAGCGASGVWATYNCGNTWDDRSGGILSGVRIYDLKVNPATVMPASYTQAAVEVWAATENGLYKSVNRGHNWSRITLPGITAVDEIVAVAISKVDWKTIYALVNTSSGMFVFTSYDSGATWDAISAVEITVDEPLTNLGYIESLVYGGGFGHYPKFAEYGGYLYTFNASGASDVAVRNDLLQTWASTGGASPLPNTNAIISDGAQLWITGGRSAVAFDDTIARGDGVVWTTMDGINRHGKFAICVRSNGNVVAEDMGVPTWTPEVFREFNAGGLVFEYQIGNSAETEGIIEYNGDLYTVVTYNPFPAGIYRHLGGNSWVQESNAEMDSGFAIVRDRLVAADNTAGLILIRDNTTQTWGTLVNLPQNIYSLYSDGDWLYAGCRGRIYRIDVTDGSFELYATATSDNTENLKIYISWFTWYDNAFIASCSYDTGAGWSPRIYRIHKQLEAEPLGFGRGHTIDTDASGRYVFIAVEDPSGDPAVVRLDCQWGEVETVYTTNDGTWAGVVCDPSILGRVWTFGDYGNGGPKVLVSDDYGDTFTDTTDPLWAADELVCPLLLSRVYPGSAIAILNTALETWETLEDGDVWYQVGTNNTAFGAQCGVRGGLYDDLVFIGRTDAGASHLQFSFSAGYDWEERSTGITALAPISAIQMLDEENEV